MFVSTPVVDANVLTRYSYQALATDPDYGQTLTYSVASGPSGLSIDPSTGLVTWTPIVAELGRDAVTLKVDDGHDGEATQSYVVDVTAQAGDHPPKIISQPVTTLDLAVSSTYSYPVRAIEPDPGVTLTYSLTTGPTGLTIDPTTGLISGLPTGAAAGDSDPIAVRVDDGRGGFDAQVPTPWVSPTMRPGRSRGRSTTTSTATGCATPPSPPRSR